MTREERTKLINHLKYNRSIGADYLITDKDADEIIKALEQEPCDDAISREDAEQMFRNIRCHLKPQDYKSAEEFNTRDLMLLNAEQMIHALPSVTQKSGKWIPVSERLPEENETVLINYCRLNEHSVRMAIWDELHCRFYNSEYTKYVSVDFVTAWMPLPEPYKGE